MAASLPMPDSRFEGYTSYEQALADYEAEPEVRIIFETGANPGQEPGAPMGVFEEHFSSWPIPETEPWRLYLQPDGTLSEALPPADGGAASFLNDPEAGEGITLADGGYLYDLLPDYDYRQPEPGKAILFESDVIEEDLVMIGHGSVDLWLTSTGEDADLEVTITDVRPDGQESYVQSGWLRARAPRVCAR